MHVYIFKCLPGSAAFHFPFVFKNVIDFRLLILFYHMLYSMCIKLFLFLCVFFTSSCHQSYAINNNSDNNNNNRWAAGICHSMLAERYIFRHRTKVAMAPTLDIEVILLQVILFWLEITEHKKSALAVLDNLIIWAVYKIFSVRQCCYPWYQDVPWFAWCWIVAQWETEEVP